MSVFLALFLGSCAGNQLVAQDTGYSSFINNLKYTAILYGGWHPSWPQSMVILYDESRYDVVPRLRESAYKKIPHLGPKDALDLALDYLGYRRDPEKLQVRVITDQEGNLVGYDFRPPKYSEGGRTENIDAFYFLEKGRRVEVKIVPPLRMPGQDFL